MKILTVETRSKMGLMMNEINLSSKVPVFDEKEFIKDMNKFQKIVYEELKKNKFRLGLTGTLKIMPLTPPKLKLGDHFRMLATYGTMKIGIPQIKAIITDVVIDECPKDIKFIQQCGRMLRPKLKRKWLDVGINGLKPGYKNYLVPNKNTLNLKQYIKRLKNGN